MMQLSRTHILRFLFIFALCLFPFGNLFRFQLSPTVSLLPLDCAVFLIALISFPEIYRNFKKSRLLQGIFAFCGIGLLCLLLSSTWLHPVSLVVSALYGVRFLAYGMLMWVCSQLKKEDKEKLTLGLLYSGCVMAAAGIVQYLIFPDLRGLFALGWDEHYFRLFGTLLDPNFSGAVFVVTLLIALNRYHIKKSPLWIAIVPLVATFLTYSRSSFLMLIASVCVYYAMKGLYKYALLGIVVVVFGVFLLPKNIRSEGVDLFRTASINSRLTEYTQAVEVFKHNLIVGVGFNAYRYAQLKYGFVEESVNIPDHAGAGVPNSFLFLLATTGIVGTVFFIAGMGFLLKMAFMQKNFLVVSCIIGLCIHALFENTLFYPFLMFQYMVLIGTQVEHHSSSGFML